MIRNLLIELQKEMEKTNVLLSEASRIAADTYEDGSKKPTTTKPRKKQKLTPEQKKKQKEEQKLVKKVKDKLKDRKYKSRKTNNDIAFNTAYNNKHPKAVADFNKAMDKERGSGGVGGDSDQPKVNYSQKATFNEEQIDIMKKLLNQGDQLEFSNLPLVVERVLKDALSIALKVHEDIDQEEATEETTSQEPKQRKTRKDKGVPRGPRLKKELQEKVPAKDQDQINLDAVSEIPKENVVDTKDVLDVREEERNKQSGEPPQDQTPQDQTPQDQTPQDQPPQDQTQDLVPGLPLFQQPVYVQKEEIKARLESAFGASLASGNEKEVRALEEELSKQDISPEKRKNIEEQLAEYERESLASTRKDTKTLKKNISDTVDALDELTEDQVQIMTDAYASGAKNVEAIMRKQGLAGLQAFLEDETKELEEPSNLQTREQINESIVDQQDKLQAANVELENQIANVELIRAEVNKLKEKQDELKALSPEELSNKLTEIENRINRSYKSDTGSITGTYNNIEDFFGLLDSEEDSLKSQQEKVDEISSELESLQKQDKNYDSYLKDYAQKLGNYLSYTHAKQNIVEDPNFGLKTFPSEGSAEDKEEHIKLVRKAQSDRFKAMEKEQRNAMVDRIDQDLKYLLKQLDDPKITKEQRVNLEGQYNNLKASQSALNTVRMINSEGVIDGYSEVPDRLLDLARSTGSETWEEGITLLSEQGTNPSKTRELIHSVTENLSLEDFKDTIGGEGGPYGDMLDLLDDKYCPGSPTNKAKGVGDSVLKPGEECPNPLSDNMKKMLREYMTGGFVNLYTVEKESNNDGYYDPKDSNKVSKKVKDQMKLFWRENKDRFFEVFVDGVDLSTGNEYTEEQREAAGEEFRNRWFLDHTQSSIDGVQLYGDNTKKFRWDQIMAEIKKVKGLEGTEKRKRLRQIRERLTVIFDETAQKPPEPPLPSTNKQANIFNSSFIDTRYKSGGTKIMQKRSTQYVDYQRRSQAFELGMRVYPFLGGNPARSGIVVAIFPAIGMVDVQFPHGASRFPVEDLVVDTSGDYKNLTNEESSVPGGLGTVPVSSRKVNKSASRVASNYVKQAIYWYKKDRTYRQCRDEEKPCCPKCKTPLGNTVYKRRGGKSEKLLACYTCLFIIKPSDIIGG
jgi:hypothetical protein